VQVPNRQSCRVGTATILYELITRRLVVGPSLGSAQALEEEVTHR
jgi:hypothetical protein